MKIKTSDLENDALDWAAAKAAGRATRDPVHASNADVSNMPIPFTLYEVVTHHKAGRDGNRLISAKVRPINVIRFGVQNPNGSTAPSISFIDSDGIEALGFVSMFYLDQAEAEIEVAGVVNGHARDFHPCSDPRDHASLVDAAGISTSLRIDGQRSGVPDVWDSIIMPECYSRGRPHTGVKHEVIMSGPNPQTAATRCYVASRLGDEVDVPDHLLNNVESGAEALNEERPRQSYVGA